jgi:hypothetical protein
MTTTQMRRYTRLSGMLTTRSQNTLLASLDDEDLSVVLLALEQCGEPLRTTAGIGR